MSAKERSIPDFEAAYTKPERTSVRGIKTHIVDPHNESFPYMHNLSSKEEVPLVVWFVDSHRDLLGRVKVCEIKNRGFHAEYGDEVITDPMEYARKCLKVDNFNCPLVHLENMSAFYYFDPPKKTGVDYKYSERSY
jgi:hypothetical protein